MIGGILTENDGEADNKIIAALQGDAIWGKCKSTSEIPYFLVERLQHYFMT